MISKINAKDATTGLLLIALALAGFYFNQEYPVGSASRMGPGYMPMLVFSLLVVLGGVLIVTGWVSGPDPLEGWALRELGLILASLAVFGVLLERIGLAAAIIALVLISSLADRTQTLKGIIGCMIGLVFLCWLIFIVGLDISVPFLPPFLVAE